MINTTIKLIDKQNIAKETMTFLFEKPVGFDFSPGAFCFISLTHSTMQDDRRNMRQLSVASAPFEEHIRIATRIRTSGFKQYLSQMPIGEEVGFRGPFGTMKLHEDPSLPAVFIAGGIGITPFRSMILQTLHDTSDRKLYLIFINKTPDEAAFHEEMKQLAASHLNFVYVPAMTQMKPDGEWKGEQGRFTIEMLKKYYPEFSNGRFYIAGPTAMVDAANAVLKDAGIPGPSILFEQFIGY